ncbi:MAG: metallophosphoesterase, partial [Thermoplasmata archaeon]
ADQWLDFLERKVPVRPGFVELPSKGFTEAVVFGDTHGDWRSSLEVQRAFLEEPGGPRCLVGLGDYVDRHPTDCGAGSVANAFLLLGIAARYPDRAFLLQGNHETTRRIPTLPHTLAEEVDELWGPQSDRYTRLVALLERVPLAAATTTGAYLAHAGFPRGPLPASWRRRFEEVDDDRLTEIVWAECDASRNRRGVAEPWGADDLGRFLARAGLAVFLRGHDPDIAGRPLYGGRCLTLHTTRIYERYGGVLIARLPLDRPVESVADVRVEHLATEGRTFPPVD